MFHIYLFSWREARSSICRLVTGTAPQAPQAPNTKLSITHSFFEVETPDFAWKFVLTVRTKYTHKKVQSTHNSAIFLGTDFAWKFIWTVRPN